MLHDPKAQDVIVAQLGEWEGCVPRLCKACVNHAEHILDALADAGLCVVSEVSEPADAEQRADSLAAAQNRVTFTSLHGPGRCSLQGCWCGERDA